MIKAVLFDMDGVLVDSEHLWTQTKIYVLKKYGVPHSRLLAINTIGLRLKEVVGYWFKTEELFKKNGLEEDLIIKEINDSIIYYYARQSLPIPYVGQALKLLKNQGLLIGLASVSNLNLINTFLEKNGLIGYFDKIISGEAVAKGKPHPEIYIKLTRLLGQQPSSCLAIEDSYNGLKASKSAQIPSIFFTNGKIFKNDPRTAISDYQIRSFKEIDRSFISKINQP